MNSAFAILRLLWSPRSLAQVAISVSYAWVIPLGAAVIALEFAAIFGGGTGGLFEPYRDLGAYFEKHADMAITWAVIASLFCAPGAILFAAMFHDKHHTRLAAGCRAVMLAPTCFMIPVLVWSVSIMLAQAQSSAVGIVKPVPAWVMFPIFQFLGSPWWLLIMVLAGIALCFQAIREVKRTFPVPDAPSCVQCGYFLTGLSERRCPECGKGF